MHNHTKFHRHYTIYAYTVHAPIIELGVTRTHGTPEEGHHHYCAECLGQVGYVAGAHERVVQLRQTLACA